MAQAKRDENRIPTLLAVSSVDGVTPVLLYADPVTHRLYVDLPTGAGDVTGPASAVDGNFASFDTTTGKLIKDSGKKAADFVAANGAIAGATKTKITYDAKGLVTAGDDATTADIADSANKRYVTDAQLVVIGNTSNTNTGDQTLASLRPVKSGTFASGSTSYVMTDAAVTADSIIDVYAQATPIGSWTVSSSAGQFTITSTKTETSNVAFKYFINNI